MEDHTPITPTSAPSITMPSPTLLLTSLRLLFYYNPKPEPVEGRPLWLAPPSYLYVSRHTLAETPAIRTRCRCIRTLTVSELHKFYAMPAQCTGQPYLSIAPMRTMRTTSDTKNVFSAYDLVRMPPPLPSSFPRPQFLMSLGGEYRLARTQAGRRATRPNLRASPAGMI